MSVKDLFNPNPKLNVLPQNPEHTPKGRFPSWLHRTLPKGNHLFQTNTILEKYKLNTVCEEAKCPNRLECYHKKTATFLALGKECTRSCGFCDIDFHPSPQAPEMNEPERIANSVKELGLNHVVITMVARDDLEDQGASHIEKIILEIRKQHPHVSIEILTSDFSGNFESLEIALRAKPEIFNHNIETVRSLSPRVRHKAQYERTLQILKHAKNSKKVLFVKSGLMVGLGEKKEEVFQTLQDLKEVGCDIITIGQYLQASRLKLRVQSFIPPDIFKEYQQFGEKIGIPQIYSGPFVRSSYNADLILKKMMKD